MLTLIDPLLCCGALCLPALLGVVPALPLRLGAVRGAVSSQPRRRATVIALAGLITWLLSYSTAVVAYTESAYEAVWCDLGCNFSETAFGYPDPKPDYAVLYARYALPPALRGPCPQSDEVCQGIERRLVFADGSSYTDLGSYLLHVLAPSLLPPAAVMWVVARWTRRHSHAPLS